MITLEQGIHLLRQSTSVWDMHITLPQVGDALQDAINRIEKLEAAVKALQVVPSVPPTPPPKVA
jgi:hypothetical protein